MRILLVDDHAELTDVLRQNLESEFFAVDVANDGEQGLFLAQTTPYDLILLDYVLPKLDGRKVCEELRKSGKIMPILMISVDSEVHDKVLALNIGADDYVTKPFSTQELVARMRALLRRPHALKPDVLRCGDLEMDFLKHRVKRGEKDIFMTRKEFMLLECLLRCDGEVVSRATLIERVWDAGLDSFSNTIDTHILNLRKKIEGVGRRKLIHTVSGVGYALHT